jgi:hypothetical protein
VTVVLAFSVTEQIAPLALVQPVHVEKLLPPAVDGAVSVTDVPAS